MKQFKLQCSHIPAGTEGVEDAFDWDTSEHALRELESRLKAFHQQHDRENKRVHAQVPELRRFTIQVRGENIIVSAVISCFF